MTSDLASRRCMCAYCGGTGLAGMGSTTECGFCDNGVPLDTQEDWDRTWGRLCPACSPGALQEAQEGR